MLIENGEVLENEKDNPNLFKMIKNKASSMHVY